MVPPVTEINFIVHGPINGGRASAPNEMSIFQVANAIDQEIPRVYRYVLRSE